jgi:hypothetical protein
MKRIGSWVGVAVLLACLVIWRTSTGREDVSTSAPLSQARDPETSEPPPENRGDAPTSESLRIHEDAPTSESRRTHRERERLAHEQRIEKVRLAHAERARDEAVGRCVGPACARVGEEIRDILDGCREHAPGTTGRIALTAEVVGAPDVGTLVRSVALTGDGASEPLRECLVESMYTLDLGMPEQAFGEQVQVFLGGGITFAMDAKSDPGLVEAVQQLEAYDGKAGDALEKSAYVISQGPLSEAPGE